MKPKDILSDIKIKDILADIKDIESKIARLELLRDILIGYWEKWIDDKEYYTLKHIKKL